MAYNINENDGDIDYEVVGDQVVLKIKPGVIPPIGGDAITNLIKDTDETVATDANVFSSLRTIREIKKLVDGSFSDVNDLYLKKDFAETATQPFPFPKGISIGGAILTWDAAAGALKVNESFYSEKEVSAYGAGSAGSGSGSSGSLGGLFNVGIWADEIPTLDRVMVQLAGSTHWSSKLLSELVGLDTTALGDYLTTNDYVTKTYVNEEISKNLHSHENKSILDLITQGNLDVLSHFSVVDGNIKVDANFWSTGEISAYGAGSGASGGGGLITSVFDSSGLGGSYLNTDYTNTFNAYTINLINTNLTTALGRIGALETSAPYAISANRLANVRTIWGQNFDGTANVMGNISGSWFAINDVAANPYLKLLENSNSWYLQGYQNKLYLGSGTANSLVLDSVGNAGIVGALTANRVNTISESHMSVGAYVDPASGIGAALKVNGNFAAGGNSYFSGGNVLIGTLVNSTYRLDVNGATRIFGGLHLNSEGWLNLYNGANTSRISLSHNSDTSKLDIYNRTTGTWATVQCGNIETQTISMYNDQIERFIRSNVFGGAIRLRGNSATASDRGIRLGRVDNSLGWLSQLAISADTGNVMIGTTTDAGYKLDVNGTFRSVGAASLNSTLNVGDLSTLKGVTVTNGTYSKAISVGSNSHLQVAGIVDSFTYTLPATIGWYRIAVSPVGIERPFGQFNISWTLSSYHGSVSLTAGMMYASAPFISVSDYANFGICITKSRIVYHTTYSGNYAYLEVYNETGKAVSLTVRGYNLYNWSLYSSSTSGSIPSGYSNKELTHIPGYATSGNVVSLGEITAYSASDARLKKEIAPLSNSLQIIQNLNPVSYRWNDIAKELNPLKGDDRDFGLIAQELELVVPELVHTIYGGQYKSIDYVKIIPHLICAIKQLKNEIDALKNNKIIHIN